mmetsp:Transcript_2334/g.5474  ORF Transcript_2334/g.5474 Transcript_2334/m.5474 type:complete len:244 (-) Transcript_2334:2312-3043(-)
MRSCHTFLPAADYPRHPILFRFYIPWTYLLPPLYKNESGVVVVSDRLFEKTNIFWSRLGSGQTKSDFYCPRRSVLSLSLSGEKVFCRQRDQIPRARLLQLRQPDRHGSLRLLQDVANRPPVPVFLCRAVFSQHPQPLLERGLRPAVRELQVVHFQHRQPDFEHLFVGVVRKIQLVWKPAAQAGVAVEQPLHLLDVAGEDDHQVPTMVLRHLDQRVQRLVTERVPPVALHKRIRLVDEQHAAER